MPASFFVEFFPFPLLHSSEKTARHRRQFPVFCGLIVWFWMHPAKRGICAVKVFRWVLDHGLSFAISTNQMRDLLCWGYRLHSSESTLTNSGRGFSKTARIFWYQGFLLSSIFQSKHKETRIHFSGISVGQNKRLCIDYSALRICAVSHSSFLSPREKTIATPTVMAIITPI